MEKHSGAEPLNPECLKFREFSLMSDGEKMEKIRRSREGNFCSSRPVLPSAALARGLVVLLPEPPLSKKQPPLKIHFIYIFGFLERNPECLGVRAIVSTRPRCGALERCKVHWRIIAVLESSLV